MAKAADARPLFDTRNFTITKDEVFKAVKNSAIIGGESLVTNLVREKFMVQNCDGDMSVKELLCLQIANFVARNNFLNEFSILGEQELYNILHRIQFLTKKCNSTC